MSEPQRIRHLALLAVAIAVALGAARGKAPVKKTASLSLSRLHIAAGERVVGFEFKIKSGRIAAVPDIPVGWDVRVENNPSWNAVVRASSLVGAAAMEAGFFKNFLVIEKNDSLGLPFDLSGDIVVTRDFVTERRIHISMKNVTLVPPVPQ